ncbi:unnamed protein product [Closterium sp. Yama58-4]|nr:unnamed protein product [Closterium sp. Yama58-4]
MVGITLSVADKLRIAELLEDLGVDYIEAGWPGSNPKDAEFFQRWKAREAAREGIDRLTAAGGDSNGGEGRRTKLAAFGATRYKNTTCEKDANVQALVESGAPVVTLVAKAWDAQVLKVLEATLEENLAMIEDTVGYFTAMGRHVMLDAEHFYDGFSANPEYAMQCVRAAARAGAKEIVLCDTNGGSMPWRVHEVTRIVVEELARGAAEGEWGSDAGVGVHCHNDCGMAVANSVEAVRAGARVVQGCINGYGERTGNADIVTAIGILQVKLGCECLPRDSLARLAEISAEIARVAGQPPNPAQPFVGANAFAHKGGIHVAALRKMPESYNHCDPSLVGNAMRSVVSDLSGRGNILEKAERAGLDLGREEAGRVLARIKQMEARGFAFENAAASVDMLIVRRGARYQIPFHVLEFSVISTNRLGVPQPMKGTSSSSSSGESGPSSRSKWAASARYGRNQPGRGGIRQVGAESARYGRHQPGAGGISQVWAASARCGRHQPGMGGISQMSAAEGNGTVDALNHALLLLPHMLSRPSLASVSSPLLPHSPCCCRHQMSAAEGNGPVDALNHALRASLDPHFPQLSQVELVDYRVRLLEPSERRSGTMSTTRVTIDFSDKSSGATWTTVGAHSSIVEASFRALIDGLEFGIVNCNESGKVPLGKSSPRPHVQVNNYGRINSPGDDIRVAMAKNASKAGSPTAASGASCDGDDGDDAQGDDAEEDWPENGHDDSTSGDELGPADIEEDEWWNQPVGSDDEVEEWWADDDVPLLKRRLRHRLQSTTKRARVVLSDDDSAGEERRPLLTAAEKGKAKVVEAPAKSPAMAPAKAPARCRKSNKKRKDDGDPGSSKGAARKKEKKAPNPDDIIVNEALGSDDEYEAAAGPIPTFPEKESPKDPTLSNPNTRPPSPRSKDTTKKRRGWTVREKLKWAHRYKELGSLKKTSVESTASVTCIRRWSAEAAAGIYKGAANCRKRMHGGGPPRTLPRHGGSVFIIDAFRHCGISSKLDGTENHLVMSHLRARSTTDVSEDMSLGGTTGDNTRLLGKAPEEEVEEEEEEEEEEGTFAGGGRAGGGRGNWPGGAVPGDPQLPRSGGRG